MKIRVAIVDDSTSFIKILSMLLDTIEEKGFEIERHVFNNPELFLESELAFDIAIIDCIFKGAPSNINGVTISEKIKEKTKNCKIILNSEFANREFFPIIAQNSQAIDFFTDKNMTSNNLLDKLRSFAIQISQEKKDQLMNKDLKLYVYKSGSVSFKVRDINYAQTKDRKKHLIEIVTTTQSFISSISISKLIDKINSSISINQNKEQKVKSDLYVNIRNIADIDEEEITFKDSSTLTINSAIFKIIKNMLN